MKDSFHNKGHIGLFLSRSVPMAIKKKIIIINCTTHNVRLYLISGKNKNLCEKQAKSLNDTDLVMKKKIILVCSTPKIRIPVQCT